MEIKHVIYWGIFVIMIGILLIIGTKARWKILVDPPEEWSPYWVHSWMKKFVDEDFLIRFNYILGIFLIIFTIIYIYFALKKGMEYWY